MDKKVLSRSKVPPEAYTREYFLRMSYGGSEFERTLGTTLLSRYKISFDLAAILPGMKVLDVGCGRGEIVLHSALAGAEAVGIDHSKEAINLAKKAITRQPSEIQARIQLFQGDVCHLPFSSQSFDRVFFLDVIEHLTPQQADLSLAEIYRVLKKDGRLVLHTTPNRFFTQYGYPYWSRPWVIILGFIAGKKTKKPPKYLNKGYDEIVHVNEQDFFRLRNVLRKHGFSYKMNLCVEPLRENAKVRERLEYAL